PLQRDADRLRKGFLDDPAREAEGAEGAAKARREPAEAIDQVPLFRRGNVRLGYSVGRRHGELLLRGWRTLARARPGQVPATASIRMPWPHGAGGIPPGVRPQTTGTAGGCPGAGPRPSVK